MSFKSPVIGIPCGVEIIMQRESQSVRKQIVDAVCRFSDAIPFLIPALGDDQKRLSEIFDNIDGLFLPGGLSHVHPRFYGQETITPNQHDALRDETTLKLIQMALDADMPVLGICRGFQAMNVVLGGTLHQDVTQVPDKRRHLPDLTLPLEEYLKVKHPVQVNAGGCLDRLGVAEYINVNTSHAQIIDRMADSLRADATADDGTVEALSRPESSFFVGIQWHPEMEPDIDPVAKPLFTAFGEAVRQYKKRRI